MPYAWKVLEKGMRSRNGDIVWKTGKWKKHEGEVELCGFGFHASKLLVDAIKYVIPGIICRVEWKGKRKERDDKFVCSEMRVLKTFRLTKRKAVEFAIYCAESCIQNFENMYPNDKRPRKAIMAAQRWLKNPTKANRSKAWSAESEARSAWLAAVRLAGSAAWSAWSAESAADSAWAAADSARAAARSVESSAESAWAAARSAWSAWLAAVRLAGSAGSAAMSTMKQKLEKKLLKIIGFKELK